MAKTKRQKGHCKKCDRDVGEANLSNQKLCYDCAKSAMVDFFDRLWSISHPR